uniref:Transcriptional regulatory protein n=1 Tax=Setaria digitata TaxID=48799 RepID=A0A915PDC7_9BILA
MRGGTMLHRRWLWMSSHFMKGHSKWDNIKDTKFAAMVNKTKTAEQLMAKMKRIVRTGGPDPKFNKDLVQLQLEYRNANFSDDTFQRALKNVQLQPQKTSKVSVRGPSGSIFIIESESLSQKKLQDFLVTSSDKLGGGFQLSKNDYTRTFEEKGVIIVSAVRGDKTLSLDEMEEICIELNCDDVSEFKEDGEVFYELICVRNRFTPLLDAVKGQGFSVKYSTLELRPVDAIEIERDGIAKITELYQALRENENITQVYANIRPNSIPVRPLRVKSSS